MPRVAKLVAHQSWRDLMLLRWKRTERTYTRLDCGCSYLATGAVAIGEEVYCSWHQR